MLQTVFIWLRQYGGLGLVAVGTAIFAATLVLEVVLGWRFSYPFSLAWTAVMVLPPAIGVAVLYLQSRGELYEDEHVTLRDGRRAARQHTGHDGREME